MSERVATAWHEAGHALVARALGRRVESVSIGMRGGSMRQEPLPPDASDEEIESALVVVLAGAEAERLAPAGPAPERNGDDPWLSDGELAAIAAEDSSGDRVSDEDVIARFAERIGEEAIERARELAAELVLRYAALGRLEQLADEILFRSHLTGDDLDRLLGAPA